jgi:hypothetical protein
MIAIEMDGAWGLPIGVPVMTADGERLGAVTHADAYELLVEDDRREHPTYALNLFDVARFEDGTLHLKLTAAEALEGRQVA